MAEGSTVVVSKPQSHKGLWFLVIAAAALVTSLVLVLPNNPNLLLGFSTRQVIYLLVVFYFAGVASGLSGFGFSGVGAASLILIPPILGTPLLQSLSTGNQLLSIGELKKDMPRSWQAFWSAPGPYIIGGLPGTVLGVWLLTHLPAAQLMITFGTILVLYSIYGIFRPSVALIKNGGSPIAGAIVGFLGGTLGGFTAFPGAAVVVWSNLRNLPKEQNRAIVQPYILVSQIYSLALLAWLHSSVFSHKYWVMLGMLLPAVLPGTVTGVAIYHKISDLNFKRMTFCCLGLSGAALLIKVLLK